MSKHAGWNFDKATSVVRLVKIHSVAKCVMKTYSRLNLRSLSLRNRIVRNRSANTLIETSMHQIYTHLMYHNFVARYQQT